MRARNDNGDTVVGLEIGTTKVVFMVAEQRDDADITVRALATHPTTGLRKGQVVDYESARTCLRETLHELEQNYSIPIHRLFLSLSGPHIQTSRNRGHVAVLNDDHEITEEEVRHVKQVAAAITLPEDRVVLHTIFGRYRIDDEQSVLRPEGMEGARLSADMLAVHGSQTHLRNLAKLVRDLDLECRATVFSGYASAAAVVRPEQKRSGVVVIDLGGGTTDYIAYASETIAAVGVLGVGGEHVTNDIAQAFGLTTREAEHIKLDHGSAWPERTTKAIELPRQYNRKRTVPLASLRTVIHARMEETFGLIRERLESEGILAHVGAGILLTGGGALLRDADVLAEKIFGKPCTVASPWRLHGEGMADRPELATVAGLVRFGLRNESDAGRRSGLFDWLRVVWAGDDEGVEQDDIFG